jgi:hypothetical protein
MSRPSEAVGRQPLTAPLHDAADQLLAGEDEQDQQGMVASNTPASTIE